MVLQGEGGTIVDEERCSWVREDVRGQGRVDCGRGRMFVGEERTKERKERARGDRLQKQDATPQKVGRLVGSGKIFP